MAFKLPKISKTQIALILSFLMNILSGTGTVKPFVGGDLPDCPAQTVDAAHPTLTPPAVATPAAN